MRFPKLAYLLSALMVAVCMVSSLQAQEEIPAGLKDLDEKTQDRIGDLHELIGGSVALQSFYASQALGMLADGLQAKLYSAEYVGPRAGGIEGGLGAVVDQLDQALATETFGEGDVKMLKEFRDVFQSLRAEAKHLMKYAAEGDAESAAAFRKERETNWKQIVKLVGLGQAENLLVPGGAKLGMEE